MMLALEAVGRRFGRNEVLRDVSLALGEGEFVALLGPSGCGKSTLLRLIAGLDTPDGGRIVWRGGERPGAGGIGFVFQDPTLLPWASAAENVWLPLRLSGTGRAAAADRVNAALAAVGLADAAERRPAALSGGMRMRVAIARALITRPRLLLLDEPFAALDEFTRHRLQEDLLALASRESMTVVFVTHSIYEACFLARRILLMAQHPGRVAEEIVSPLARGRALRTDPAYDALVHDVSRRMRAHMGEAA